MDLPVLLSPVPFSAPSLGLENFKVMASGPGWRYRLLGLSCGTGGLAGAEGAGDPGKYFPFPTHPPQSKGICEGKTDPETFGPLSVWTNSKQGSKWLEKIQASVEKSSISFFLEMWRPCTFLYLGKGAPGQTGCVGLPPLSSGSSTPVSKWPLFWGGPGDNIHATL